MEKFDDVRSMIWDNSSKNSIVQTPNLDILKTLQFNSSTTWSDEELPNFVMEYGKKPPLGICDLHKKGILCDGVNVAIIDQPLALDHPEYKGKIAKYKTFCPNDYKMGISSMHGPAVTSLLVGETIGVAPKAKVFYAATPTWLGDAKFEAQALKWIMEENAKLPEKEKIKFVSVSAAPGDEKMREKNRELWFDAVKEAEESGLCVVDCTEGHRFVTIGYVDFENEEFKLGFPNMMMKKSQSGEVHVPNSFRTVAESFDNRQFSYAYWGVGGLSWGIPYAVGTLCLGQSLNKDLSAFELKTLLLETASKNGNIINPKSFLACVKEKKEERTK